jgi:REP element-mobilizing transposase RayT
MPRPLRIEYPGAIYHAMNRGDRRQDIFRDDEDRLRFLATLAEACKKMGWQIHAYCLMRNHFHLVVETPRPNLVEGMKWLLGVYTKRFNIRHKFCGHLFAGRYKALVVEGGGDGYLQTVCDYVHLNPARAKLLKAGQRLESFRWSSFGDYLKPGKERPPWLRVDRVLGEKGIGRDSKAGRREFARLMALRQSEGCVEAYEEARRAWSVGSEAFQKELVEAAKGELGPNQNHYGADRRESEENRAQRLVTEELNRMGWSEEELRTRRKWDKEKVRLAARLRKETSMSLKWIAQRLEMGSWTYVSNLLIAERKKLCQ